MMNFMIDAVVVGAGIGGLMAAAKLSGRGKRVLVLEKKLLPGGTAYVFRRGGYMFPMGPLSFSYPNRVQGFLDEAGLTDKIAFRRNGFELRTPHLDLMMSQSLPDLQSELSRQFPAEVPGLAEFFSRLRAAVAVARGMDLWRPEFIPGRFKNPVPRAETPEESARLAEARRLSLVPAAAELDRLIARVPLKNLLGSLGTSPPEMSMLTLASMWNVMAEEGIWFPVCGVHGIADLLWCRIAETGGEVRLAESVHKIVVRNGRAAGVILENGQTIESRWVISNADFKTTFLGLLDAKDIPGADLGFIREAGYTGSELGVYLGLRPDEVDLSAIRAEHLFYRRTIRGVACGDPEDFDDHEIEICLWSRKAPDQVPSGRASLVLRVGIPYGHFACWRLGDKVRKKGYREYKTRLAEKLIRTVETILPGLSSAVEIMETATPLTYRDWGGRYEGSIAGWSWSAAEAGRLPGRLLVRTPVPGLLAAGIYAASDLFLGGVPTALYTGSLAADYVLAG